MDWAALGNSLSSISSIATAIGVGVAAFQLRASQLQAVTQFEDDLGREYRAIAQRLPIEALLGEELSDDDYKKALKEFYHYIDLSNEQVFLRQLGRVRKNTWLNWRDGIKANLARPAFGRAWEEIKRRSDGSFQELRRLEASNFRVDPATWKH